MIRLNKTLGENYTNDLDDVRNVKKALNKIGHYDVPDYGLTKYPDKNLFEGVRSFQKQENLAVDGIMNPDGETIIALNNNLYPEDPGVRSPTFWCACGAPHGGVYGDICQNCYFKQ